MADAETLAFLLGRENFDANAFVADDTNIACSLSSGEYGYRAKAVLALASSDVWMPIYCVCRNQNLTMRKYRAPHRRHLRMF